MKTIDVAVIFSFFYLAIPKLIALINDFSVKTIQQYRMVDLLINYKGGFVRRGLFGQILTYFVNYIDILNVVPVLMVGLFLVFVFITVKWMLTFLDIDLVLLFIYSPALLSFIFGYGAFFRRDLFVLMAFFLMLQQCFDDENNCGNKTLLPLYLRFWCIYFIGFLVSENMFVYMPLAAVILGIVSNRAGRQKLWAFVTGGVFLVSIAVALLGSANQNATATLHEYLQATYHGYDVTLGYPVDALRESLFEAIPAVFNNVILKKGVLFCTLMALMLTMVPVGLMFVRYKIHKILSILLPNLLLQAAFLVALLCPWALFLCAIDYGRWVHMIGVTYMLTLAGIVNMSRTGRAHNTTIDRKFNLLYIVFLFMYVSTWELSYINSANGVLPSTFGRYILGILY